MTQSAAMDWRTEGACRDMPPDMFFPLAADSQEARDAKTVCSVCPVQAECREWGLANESQGIWGGLDESARRSIRRYRRRQGNPVERTLVKTRTRGVA